MRSISTLLVPPCERDKALRRNMSAPFLPPFAVALLRVVVVVMMALVVSSTGGAGVRGVAVINIVQDAHAVLFTFTMRAYYAEIRSFLPPLVAIDSVVDAIVSSD